jgi:hypothetical protein
MVATLKPWMMDKWNAIIKYELLLPLSHTRNATILQSVWEDQNRYCMDGTTEHKTQQDLAVFKMLNKL